jgi:uncharacterized protein
LRTYLRFFLPVVGAVMAAFVANSQTLSNVNNDSPALIGVPGPFTWQHSAEKWQIENGTTLSITAGRATDWFSSPMGDEPRDNTPRLLFKPAEDFVLSAKVTVAFQSQWDSGALVLYVNDLLWAKLCFEMTIEKRPTIVSVVTRDLSDDNNSIAINGSSVYLKIAKAGQAIFFYASEDGRHWTVIRAFSLGKNTPDLRVGFSSQSPAGDGCTSRFSEIMYASRRVDLWSGQ